MSSFLSIRALWEEGVSKKTIARQLGLDVRTVRRYIRLIRKGHTEPRKATSASCLDPFRPVIEQKVQEGLSATQIYQDLCELESFDASYSTLRRFVRKLRRTDPEVYCRMRYRPGEEAQIDFGDIGRLPVEGVLRRVYIFAMTLCFSRYAYYELVLDQTVPTFLGAIRRGFEFFGGVPQRLKPDNLKSAVLLDALGQRYYQEDFFRFCRHYGTLPDAARPRTPTDKGRVERDIGYAKGNCFRGRQFKALEEAEAHLVQWREGVANLRLHGTTRRRPCDLFAQEKPHLLPLPEEPYEICRWGRYRVRQDCHIHIEGNYYSVPYKLVGQDVTVRIAEDALTVFSQNRVQARHERLRGKGGQATDLSHYPVTKRLPTQEIHRRRLDSVRSAGPHAAEFLHRLRQGPWVFGSQAAQMAGLVREHGGDALDQACRRALFFQATDGAGVVERILKSHLHTLPLPGAEVLEGNGALACDYGRPLAEYAALLSAQEVLHG